MTSGVDTKHPQFSKREPDFKIMRDAVEGERQIKEAGTEYLKATSGMVEDGMAPGQKGFAAYDAYRSRARYPDLVGEAVEALLGVMWRKPPNIELPAAMEDLREKITIRGESMEMLLRRVNEEQLTTGRVGLIGDVVGKGERAGELYAALYHGEKPINWDEGAADSDEPNKLQMVVIDETADERIDTFTWEEKRKHRVLFLGDPTVRPPEETEDEEGDKPAPSGPYGVQVVGDGETFNPEKIVNPNIRGRTIDEIPFVFINTKDVVPEPDAPPLLGLANLCLAIYRGEADFRQALFMQGQDTLVTIGLAQDDDTVRVGANARINIPNHQGDAKFIGVDSQGLPEMRTALENDYDRAAQRGGQLLDTIGAQAESGEALRIRVSAKTATLTQIAITGAFGFQSLLRILARWMGANPEEVIVTPHLDFVASAGSKTVVELTSAKVMGAPLSWETIHERAQEEGVTDVSFDDEKARLMAEAEDEALNLSGQDTEEGDPVDDDDPNDDGGEGGGDDEGEGGDDGGDQ